MKKLKKYDVFSKKPSYLSLLIKYNTLVIKHDALIEEVKNDLYDKIFERIFRETEKLKHYEEENKELRLKIRELKKKLMDKK